MSELPLSIGTMHFTGIGGIGMSGLPKSYLSLATKFKEAMHRITPMSGGCVARVWLSSGRAPTILQALRWWSFPLRLNLIIRRWLQLAANSCPLHRAEMLGELMRLRWSIGGCWHARQNHYNQHCRNLLSSANIDPTVINGGIISGWGSNARLGKGKHVIMLMRAMDPLPN